MVFDVCCLGGDCVYIGCFGKCYFTWFLLWFFGCFGVGDSLFLFVLGSIVLGSSLVLLRIAEVLWFEGLLSLCFVRWFIWLILQICRLTCLFCLFCFVGVHLWFSFDLRFVMSDVLWLSCLTCQISFVVGRILRCGAVFGFCVMLDCGYVGLVIAWVLGLVV